VLSGCWSWGKFVKLLVARKDGDGEEPRGRGGGDGRGGSRGTVRRRRAELETGPSHILPLCGEWELVGAFRVA